MTDDSGVLRTTMHVEDESVEYVEGEDVVRFQKTVGANPQYDTMPVEKWVEFRAAEAAKDVVQEELNERVDGDISGVGTGISSTDDGATKTVKVYHERWRNEDGTVTEPSISFDRLQEITPERVETTAEYHGETYARSIPVQLDTMESQFL